MKYDMIGGASAVIHSSSTCTPCAAALMLAISVCTWSWPTNFNGPVQNEPAMPVSGAPFFACSAR